jgi:hypothetical protein
VPELASLESILLRLPPEGQAWFTGLNAYCRWAVEQLRPLGDIGRNPPRLVG